MTFDWANKLCSPKKEEAKVSSDFKEWPKMLYHPRIAKKGKIFNSPEEFLREEEAGWSEKPI